MSTADRADGLTIRMDLAPPTALAHEVVPLAERTRYLHGYRVLTCASAVALALVDRAAWGGVTSSVAVAAVLYLAVTSAAIQVVDRRPGIARRLFTGLLIGDGVFLGWATFATGGMDTPLRYLVVVHLVLVALLASYRTGLKLVIWHSLVLMIAAEARGVGLFPTAPAEPTDGWRLFPFIGVLWIVTLLTSVASSVNERELRRRRFDLEALAALATEFERTAEPRDVAELLVGAVADTFDLERVLLVDVRGAQPELLAATAGTAPAPAATTTTGGLIARAVEERRDVLVTGLGPEDRWLARILPDAANLVAVPLIGDGRTNAVLLLEYGLRHGTRVERRVMTTLDRFASHAALALSNAVLHQELRERAATDGLTGLANRRTFDQALDTELARSARNGGTMAVVLLDLDRFKSLNDTHGHLVGDDVLRGVAATLAGACRAFDTPARYGGEEFAVVLPNTSAEDAAAAGERFRAAIEQAGTVVPVTVSIGIAMAVGDDHDASSLVGAADTALYAAKNGGRNQVQLAWSRDPAEVVA